MRRNIFIILLLLSCAASIAAKPPALRKFNLAANVESKHIWRGISSSSTPTFTSDLSYHRNNWSGSVWIAKSFDQQYTEMDLMLTWAKNRFAISLYDYYCPRLNEANQLIDYTAESTRHAVDLLVQYKPGGQNPVNILGSLLVYGDDRNDSTGDNYYSAYLEMAYTISTRQHQQIVAKLGYTPYERIYASKAGFVNMQLSFSRVAQISKTIKLPITAEIIANPVNKMLTLNFQIGLIA